MCLAMGLAKVLNVCLLFLLLVWILSEIVPEIIAVTSQYFVKWQISAYSYKGR